MLHFVNYNLKCFEILIDSLQLDLEISKTESFKKEPSNKTDYRLLVKRNFKLDNLNPYTQVFTEKHGYVSNLSILDLLFNEGPNTELYLKKQSIRIND